MSVKAAAPVRKLDRRVRQTRNALGDALMALIQEKPFDSITVQEVLDRAGVARSTFYTHFRDKDDLFFSDVEDFLDLMAGSLDRQHDQSQRVAPICELFAHVAEMRHLHGMIRSAGKMHDFVEMGEGVFARAIDRRLAHLPRSKDLSAEQRGALSHAFAGALFSLMSWWLAHPGTTPQQMDEMYHSMVWSSVGEEMKKTPN